MLKYLETVIDSLERKVIFFFFCIQQKDHILDLNLHF